MIAKGTTKFDIICHGEKKVQRIFKGTNKVYEFIPKEYMEVKCVITDGRSYIDSNYVFTGDTSIDITFETPSEMNANQTLFYSGGTGTLPIGFIMCSVNNNYRYRYAYRSVYNGRFILDTNTKYNLKALQNNIYINDDLVRSFTKSTFTTPYTMPFFAQYLGSTSPVAMSKNGTKIYYIKIYDDDDVLVRDMVPCYRKSDNEIGFFDRVNKVFYTNLGAGDFTYESL
jgi:hypothetical protein